MIKILNLKFVILLEYQNLNTFLQKALFQTAEIFYEKELQKTN